MRTRTTTTITVIGNRLLFSLQQHKTHFEQVNYLLSLFSLRHHCSSESCIQEPEAKPHESLTDIASPRISSISKSVLAKCSHLLVEKSEPCTDNASSLKEFLLALSNLNPKATRKFWRVSELKPKDVLELLLGFESDSGKLEIEVKKVRSLWGIFKWAGGERGMGFKHLDQSFKVMAAMLVRVGLFEDAEYLLSTMEKEGILLDNHEIFSNLIEWYMAGNELEKGISMYDRMRVRNLVPTSSCCCALLNHLVCASETQLVLRVFVDMLEMEMGKAIADKGIYGNAIRLFCRVGKVQEARNIIKKAFLYGIKPTSLILDAIATGYCEKKDYNDLLSLFAEISHVPDVMVGNKIIHSLCSNFGAEDAFAFMQELEYLGYCPDEITFGILIGWSCQEGKLKSAFIYLSDVLSRGLKPHVSSYNALISGVFKEGMWKHAHHILREMDDKAIRPNMSTFRVLLAGYCKARQFDEVKVMIGKMVEYGLIELSPVKDPLSKAFVLLGIDPLAARVRRDNDVKFSKTEFFDSMGNGLYLEGDVVEYEETMRRILHDSMIPDYNSLILNDDGLNSHKAAFVVIDKMVRWGQELSFPAFSILLKRFRASNSSFKAIPKLLEKMPKSHNELDEETLNLLVQAHIKKGFLDRARTVFDEMVKRNLQIEKKTYSALISGFCKKGNMKDLHHCLELAQNGIWLPTMKDYRTLMFTLGQKDMLMEALVLFEHVMLDHPHQVLELFYPFVEKLCGIGFTKIARVLFEELLVRGYELDQMAYSHLLKGFIKEKCFSEVFALSNTMLSKSIAPDTDVSVLLISQLCRHGYFDRAIILKDICSREDPSSSLPVHCALNFSTGMVEEVPGLIQEMTSKGKPLNVEVYDILLHGYSGIKDLKKVREVLVAFLKSNISISISSYRKLVSLFCTEGQLHYALSVKELMLKEMSSSSLIAYNILIFYLFSSKNIELVDVLLDEIQEKGLEFDDATYKFLVYGFSRCKAVSRSCQYLTAMMSKDLKPSNRCVRAVISTLCSGGELSEVLKLSREMERRGLVHCSTIQNEIVRSLLRIGKLQEAVSFLDKMALKDLIPDNINYDSLIKQLCYYERQDRATDLLDIMLKKGNTPNSTSYDYVIQGLCASHRIDEALDFYTEMLNRNLKPSTGTQEVLVQQLCELGKATEAENLIHSMVRTGEIPSRAMFSSVVTRYRFENKYSKASELLQTMQQCGHKPDFETHWSLISTLTKSSDKETDDNSSNFLSRLLSESGFSRKKEVKRNRGS